MLKFLVWHVLFVVVTCELYKEESGYVVQYAPTYSNYKPRDYHFDYAVSDPHTGDHKSQWEVKTDGVVRGGYSLLEPDGTTRIVEYIADDHGFRAVVKKLGTAIHPQVVPHVPVLAQPVPEVVHPVPEVVQPLPQVSHYSTYDGHVANYVPRVEVPHVEVPRIEVPRVEVPPIRIEVPPFLYRVEQSLGSGALISPPQALGILGPGVHNLGVPLIQSQEVRPVPLEGHKIVEAPLLQTANVGEAIDANLGRVEVVPTEQGQDIGRIDGVPLPEHGLERVEVAPVLQGGIDDRLDRIGAVSLQGHGLEGVNAVPVIQDQNLGRIEAGLERHNLEQLDAALARAEAELREQHNGGRIDADLRVPIEVNNIERGHLPQPQIEIYNSRPIPRLDQGRGEEGAVPGIVPVSPSYTTNIEYESLAADNQLKKDIYHASYSEKVLKVVPSPPKHEKKTKKDFLIYYPDSEHK